MEGIKVLLVDDEPELVEILSGRLRTRGLGVDTALNGDEALSMLRHQDYDVIILDVFMPGKDGIQTLKEAKFLKPLTEVIMLSGNATLELAIEGMQNGAFDFLVKPAEMGDLVEKINKAFARKAEQEERIRRAGFIKEQILDGGYTQGQQIPFQQQVSSVEWPEVSGHLLVIGQESDFSQDLIHYALEISRRMSYGILALNAAGFNNESFRLFPKARDRVCEDFQEISQKNAALFRNAATREGVPFAHVVKFCERDEAIDEVIKEFGIIDYVVSESGEGPNKGEIFAYCPM